MQRAADFPALEQSELESHSIWSDYEHAQSRGHTKTVVTTNSDTGSPGASPGYRQLPGRSEGQGQVFVTVVLGHKASHVLSTCSATELHPSPLQGFLHSVSRQHKGNSQAKRPA